MRRRRVTLVEDSPTARLALKLLLEELHFEVAGVAATVADAEAAVLAQRPDVVLSDVRLPDGDGITLARRVLRELGVPIVLMTAHDPDNPALVFEALQAGALEVLPKPPSRRHPDWPAYVRTLERTLRSVASIPVVTRRRAPESMPAVRTAATPPCAAPALPGGVRDAIVLIGASTGGPLILPPLARALAGASFRYAVVAQHTVPDFAESFRAWLAQVAGRPVTAAQDGELPQKGGLYTIPGHAHLRVAADGRFQLLAPAQVRCLHAPCIDLLFGSVVPWAPSAVAVLLTGMGADGADGLQSLRRAGAWTVVQAPETAAVDAMPRAALQRDAACEVRTPDGIAQLLGGLAAR